MYRDGPHAFDIESTSNKTPESQTSSATGELMRRAAQELGENLTDFIIRSACAEAELTLADQRRFSLDADQWNALWRH